MSLGWSQGELAERAGVTRQLVSAVEASRHSPNVMAAIRLARALGVSVEDLFVESAPDVVDVFGGGATAGTPVIAARVGELLVSVPVEHGVSTSEAWGVADAVVGENGIAWLSGGESGGLVIAGCDPMVGMIAGLVGRTSPHRVIAVHGSTGRAVEALAAGRVHGVMVHAPAGEFPVPPVPVRRWRVARWQVGLASGGASVPSVEELIERRARVVQRDAGAGSQRALERALSAAGAGSALPGPVASGHIDVARRVAQGGGRAGVTMEAAAGMFGLGFEPLETHEVELWLDERWHSLPAAMAFVEVLCGPLVADRAAVLPGYDLSDCGTVVAGR